MEHKWIIIKETDEKYYLTQEANGTWNTIPVTIDKCEICNLERMGPYAEQGCHYFHDYYINNEYIFPMPKCKG